MTTHNASNDKFSLLFDGKNHLDLIISSGGDSVFKAQYGYEKTRKYDRFILDQLPDGQWTGIHVNREIDENGEVKGLGKAERPTKAQKQNPVQLTAEIHFNRPDYNQSRIKAKDDQTHGNLFEDIDRCIGLSYEDPRPECLQDEDPEVKVIHLVESLLNEHPDWAAAFIAKTFKGQTLREYAALTGQKEVTISSHYCKAKKFLAKKIPDRRTLNTLLAD